MRFILDIANKTASKPAMKQAKEYITHIIQDGNILNRMSKEGHISYNVKHSYVTDYASKTFKFDGKWYECKYYSGCFNPFVTITKLRKALAKVDIIKETN